MYFFCNLKERDNIRGKITGKNKNYVKSVLLIFFICQKLSLARPVQQNLNCSCLSVSFVEWSNTLKMCI